MKITQIDKTRVKTVLQAHLGKANAINGKELAEKANCQSSENSLRGRLRATIRELIIVDKMLIGYCNEGFYVIETQEEFEESLANLDIITAGTEKRKRALRIGWMMRQIQKNKLEKSKTKVFRILMMDGNTEWVKNTLNNSAVTPDKALDTVNGKIEELKRFDSTELIQAKRSHAMNIFIEQLEEYLEHLKNLKKKREYYQTTKGGDNRDE